MASVLRVGFVTATSAIVVEVDAVFLLRLGAKPQRECEVVPTMGLGEGPVGTDECPEDCKHTMCCESCEKVAVFWTRKYNKSKWPTGTGARPTG